MTAVGMAPTLAVSSDGVLWWYPKFVSGLTSDELAGVLVHEAMHLALKHNDRAVAQGITPDLIKASPEGFTKARLWNIAGDLSINQEVRKFATLPKDGCFPENFKLPLGLATEEYYRLLQQEHQKQQQQAKGQGGEPQEQPGGAGSGACGGCAGNPVPGEPGPNKAKGEGRSEAELERMRRATAEAVQEHAAKSKGDVPASLKRWADEMLKPAKIPWRQKLARLVRGAVAYRAGATDFTWSRMSRRQSGVGFGVGRAVIPATHSPQPNVAVVIDTSGSMGEDDLAAGLSELQGVLDAVGAQVTFVVCDAMVHGIKPVKTAREAMGMLKGGGGTAMEPALDEIAKLQPKVSVAVVLTDGYIDDPPEYAFNVIYCIIGKNTSFTPRFGEAVFVDDEA